MARCQCRSPELQLAGSTQRQDDGRPHWEEQKSRRAYLDFYATLRWKWSKCEISAFGLLSLRQRGYRGNTKSCDLERVQFCRIIIVAPSKLFVKQGRRVGNNDLVGAGMYGIIWPGNEVPPKIRPFAKMLDCGGIF